MTLELRDVAYAYPGYRREAIRDVGLRVGAGEIVGLTGPNEAGKSTLCLVASGLAPASIGGELRGDVLVDGDSSRGLRTHELAALVGIVFANPASQLSGVTTTVFDEVAFGPVNIGLPAAASRSRAEASMERLGIADLAARDPARLSGGQTQLVAIASMVAMRPRYLVLDEPVQELDPDARPLVADAIRSLASAGIGVLIAEHDTDLLQRICDRIVAIDAGTLSARR